MFLYGVHKCLLEGKTDFMNSDTETDPEHPSIKSMGFLITLYTLISQLDSKQS